MPTSYYFNPGLLRRAREAAGLTPVGLADRAGTSFNAVYMWENGRRVPSAASLGKIAAALGVEPNDLFSRRREPHEATA
jgi:transcriptional regulator with XRE-family HTH domain